MSHFPSTSVDVKSWISTVLGEDERKSLDIIIRLVDEHEIDGKLLLLLYKYPNELFHLIPNLRARLLFMNALDVLIKAAVS